MLTFDDGADVEVLDEELGVHGGRHEDDLEVAVLGDAVPQHGHQEVGEAVPLVDLVNNHCRGTTGRVRSHTDGTYGPTESA